MKYQITITSSLREEQLVTEVSQISETSAFKMTSLSHLGGKTWQMDFAPRRENLWVSFTKFAELQLGIARLGDVLELRRTDVVTAA